MKIANKIVGLALGLATAIGALFLYWAFQGSQVLSFNSYPIPVKPVEVQVDGVIALRLNYCKNVAAHGAVEAFIVSDKTEINIPWPDDNSKRGCVDTWGAAISIPAQAATGTYHVVFRVVYKVNPIKSVPVELRSEDFKIVNPKLEPGDAKPVVP